MADLFDELVPHGHELLVKMIEARAQENVSLEFKEKRDPSRGGFDADDRRNLGKTLSAFSNSMGGVLVFGVRAEKNEDGIDCATELKPISEIELFLSEANSLIGQIISPMNDGIRAGIVEIDENENIGFLAVSIERSERRPHRSEAKGDKAYYKRIGDGSYQMEHYDIEDAFRRQSAPELQLGWVARKIDRLYGEGAEYQNIRTVLQLENRSGVTALFPFIYVHSVRGAIVDGHGVDGNGGAGLPKLPSVEGHLFGGGADHVIHPGQKMDVMALVTTSFKDGKLASTDPWAARMLEAVEEKDLGISLECTFGSKDSRSRTLKIEVSGADLREILSD